MEDGCVGGPCSTFPDTSKREMIVRSLLKSNGVSMPTPGQTKGKKEDSKTLDKARLLASASSLARVLQQMMAADLTAGASSEGTSKQSGVFNCLTEAFRCCLDAMELKKREVTPFPSCPAHCTCSGLDSGCNHLRLPLRPVCTVWGLYMYGLWASVLIPVAACTAVNC